MKQPPSDRRAFLQKGVNTACGLLVCPLLLPLACERKSGKPLTRNPYEDEGVSTGGVKDDKSKGDDNSSNTDDSRDTGEPDNGEATTFATIFGSFTQKTSGIEAVEEVCKSLDFSWLKRGDSVLVKVACNSGIAHPATTAVDAVKAICTELKNRGAGRIIVADQAGVEYVRLAKGNRKKGSTISLMKNNGIYNAATTAGAEVYAFESEDYESGYFQANFSFKANWPSGPYIAKIISEVDHIISLPRLSSHVLAGYSHGLKSSIGWLRDDSRYLLHADAGTFHEKFVEVNYCEEIKSRYRLTLTLVQKALLYSGPDTGKVVNVNPFLIIASQNVAYHDTLSVALQAYIQMKNPGSGGLDYGTLAPVYNNSFIGLISTSIPWTSASTAKSALRIHNYQNGIANDYALQRAYVLSGGKPSGIPVKLLGEGIAGELETFLKANNGGIFRFG